MRLENEKSPITYAQIRERDKALGLEIYSNYQDKSEKSFGLAIKVLIASGLIFLYKESFSEILKVPLLNDKIEIMIKTIQTAATKMGFGTTIVATIISFVSRGYEKKAQDTRRDFNLTVKDIKKYYSNEKGKGR